MGPDQFSLLQFSPKEFSVQDFPYRLAKVQENTRKLPRNIKHFLKIQGNYLKTLKTCKNIRK